jgi:endogenous inhibitor of DNA gyrase (YacG/DUF329 family)
MRVTSIEIECRWCGKKFTVTPTEYKKGYRLCSWECRLAEREDEKHRICPICSKEFIVKRPSTQTVTCSNICAYELRKRGAYKQCEICGELMWVMPVHSTTKRFCSKKCSDIGHSRDMSGDKHPNWCGGTSKFPYPFGFNDELKTRIKERDGNKCMNCGLENDLTVHHIDYNKDNLSDDNLITLCNPCNCKANYHRSDWKIKYQSMLEVIYG